MSSARRGYWPWCLLLVRTRGFVFDVSVRVWSPFVYMFGISTRSTRVGAQPAHPDEASGIRPVAGKWNLAIAVAAVRKCVLLFVPPPLALSCCIFGVQRVRATKGVDVTVVNAGPVDGHPGHTLHVRFVR